METTKKKGGRLGGVLAKRRDDGPKFVDRQTGSHPRDAPLAFSIYPSTLSTHPKEVNKRERKGCSIYKRVVASGTIPATDVLLAFTKRRQQGIEYRLEKEQKKTKKKKKKKKKKNQQKKQHQQQQQKQQQKQKKKKMKEERALGSLDASDKLGRVAAPGLSYGNGSRNNNNNNNEATMQPKLTIRARLRLLRALKHYHAGSVGCCCGYLLGYHPSHVWDPLSAISRDSSHLFPFSLSLFLFHVCVGNGKNSVDGGGVAGVTFPIAIPVLSDGIIKRQDIKTENDMSQLRHQGRPIASSSYQLMVIRTGGGGQQEQIESFE
ncbi:hypothetical protein M0802_010342 [Mischocyttarus mexicanus]|nr:hypothetical protein M0802_010342 [Mischocyttarus mexicanus]